MALEKIQAANDIKSLPPGEIPLLCAELRSFLISHVAETGGHLASNLGAVELTVALHLEFDPTVDRLIFDVGHQSYTHKILTGRKEEFATLRKQGGLSGFPKRKESVCDPFDTGHSSTSISAGLGLAWARDLSGEDHAVVSVIGDGALTGGLAYEAMNNASKLKSNFIILLNDNHMSISENVGGISTYLTGIRTAGFYRDLKEGVKESLGGFRHGNRIIEQISRTKNGFKSMFLPGMYFENMGIIYLGPIDGHDVGQVRRMLRDARRICGPVLVHVITKKGKGYPPAERHPERFHGTDPFDVETGKPVAPKKKRSYTDVFASAILKAGEKEERLVAVTAAMAEGTGLKRFAERFPERFFDVGIAEGHAVTFAAGLAVAGWRPVVAVYSSFLQRAFDQVLHDVCIQDLPVVFCVDRAGLVGSDGETHQGLFDLSYLGTVPGLTLMAPKNRYELTDMLRFALTLSGPSAIRYPRGEAWEGLSEHREPLSLGRAEVIAREEEICLFAYGSMVKTAEEVRRLLKEAGRPGTLVNARFAKPLDRELLKDLAGDHRLLVTLEENVARGGFGEAVRSAVAEEGLDFSVLVAAVPDTYVPHGNTEYLKEMLGLSAPAIVSRIQEALS